MHREHSARVFRGPWPLNKDHWSFLSPLSSLLFFQTLDFLIFFVILITVQLTPILIHLQYMHWGLDLQVVCVLNQQFLLCLFKVVRGHHIKDKRLEGVLLFIWGLHVFTYALLQRPWVISLFLAALTKPSVMRFRLHHSHGNFQLNVWG